VAASAFTQALLMMNLNTRHLHDLGQRLWLDNITRDLLQDGTLARYIRDLSVTGLTSNPSIFDRALASSSAYDGAIAEWVAKGTVGEELFFALALEDLTQAARLLRPFFDASLGLDGWVSLEVSPLLAHDAARSFQAAAKLHAQAVCPNLFVKIPGTTEGLLAIEESIFQGIPINVTLLFSRHQYLLAANAYLRGLERRQEAGLNLGVASVASLFISRWDVAAQAELQPRVQMESQPQAELQPKFHNRLGVAMAMQTYDAHCDLLSTPRWARLAAAGARPQRLLWASTGMKDPLASDTFYADALVAANTINTLPEATLLAVADHGKAGTPLPADGGNSAGVLADFKREGIDIEALAAKLQADGLQAFTKSWGSLLARLADKSANKNLAHSSGS
jgi:transaldolase